MSIFELPEPIDLAEGVVKMRLIVGDSGCTESARSGYPKRDVQWVETSGSASLVSSDLDKPVDDRQDG